MSICQLRNTSNALTFRMSGEQIRLQVAHKLLNIKAYSFTFIRTYNRTMAEHKTVPES